MARIVKVTSYCVEVGGHEAYLGRLPSGEETPTSVYFLRPPWRSLYSRAFETLLVSVETDTGEVGWGEALAPVAPEVVAEIVDQMLAPVLVGRDSREVAVLRVVLTELMRERGHMGGHQADALAAVDIALWDLKGRLCGEGVASLLGGPFRREIPVYVSGLPQPTDEERVELAREWVSKGFRRIKLALGYGVEEDLATYDAVATVDPGLKLSIDAHWAYDLADALRLGKGLDERGAWFLEAPMVPEDVEAHAELARALVTPVAVGEALRNRFEFRPWISSRAVDLCQPDVARTGISELVAIARYAEAHHLPLAPHHSVGLGVSLAAGLHAAAALGPLTAFEYQPTTLELANRMLVEPIGVVAGLIVLPEGPGLGVEIDVEAVSKHARRISS